MTANFLEATKVVVCPEKEGLTITLSDNMLRIALRDKIFKIGDMISYIATKSSKPEKNHHSNDTLGFAEMIHLGLSGLNTKMKILETVPMGLVKITDKTEVIHLSNKS
jgi:hypothetical protein